MSELDGKRALITGAGKGLGRAISIALALEGVDVILVARTLADLEETAALIHVQGGSATVVAADVSTETGLALAIAATPVDILINNAASLGQPGATAGVSRERWVSLLALNVLAPTSLTTAVLPGMIKKGWGRIVNVSAGIAEKPASLIGANVYAASKAALEAHSINLAAELSGVSGVTVNIFRPGMLDTPLQATIRNQAADDPVARAAVDRFASAHAAGALASADAAASSLVKRLPSSATGQIWSTSASSGAESRA